jgi:phosphoribosyl-dephospho-CoA transferase
MKFKLEVVRYGQEHGNGAAGRKFDIDEMNLRGWSGEKEKLERVSKRNCVLCSKKCKYLYMQATLFQYIMNVWKN